MLDRDQFVTVINGMGGVGKTTLAETYLHVYSKKYQHIVWITLGDDEIEKDVLYTKGLAENLGIQLNDINHIDGFNLIMRSLRNMNESTNLLILDNAKASLANYKDRIPSAPNWHLLVTSRENIFGFEPYPLDCLSESDSLELFKKLCPAIKDDKKIINLLKKFEFHTLTVEIMALTAKQQSLSINALDDAITGDIKSNTQIKHSKDKRVEKVYSYLSAVFSLNDLNDDELWLMKQFVCLPPSFINYELLYEVLCPEKFNKENIFSDTLNALTDKGWLKKNEKETSYKMHRLISEVVFKKLQLKLIDMDEYLTILLNLLSHDPFNHSPTMQYKYTNFGLTLLKRFPKETNKRIILLQSNLASIFCDIGDYHVAKQLEKKALSLSIDNYGEDHQDTAIEYSNMGMIHRGLGNFKAAKTYLEKALVSAINSVGEKHPTTAINYSNLASVLQDLEDYEGAKKHLKFALASNIATYGKSNPNTSISYSNLGMLLKTLGDYQGAKKYLRKALASAIKSVGKSHPTTTINYSNMGNLLCDLGDYKLAKKYLKKALTSSIKTNGEEHPNTSMCYSKLGMVLKSLGDYHNSKNYLTKALDSAIITFGEGHPTTAIRYSNLGLVLKDLKDYHGAKKHLEIALASNINTFGEDHSTTAINYSNLGLVLKYLEDYQGAKKHLKKALASIINTFGEDHPTTALISCNLGTVLQDLEDYQGAKKHIEKALVSDLNTYGENHPATANRYDNLASVHKKLGNYEEAKEHLEKALASNSNTYEEDHQVIQRIKSRLKTINHILVKNNNVLG